jgi:hypothetical protein
MRSYLFVLIIALSLIGCNSSSPIYIIKTSCNDISKEDFISQMEKKLIENNFRINKADRLNGFLQAEIFMEGSFVADPGLSQIAQFSGNDFLYMWTFKYDSGLIEATARKISITRTPQGDTQFSREKYYNDENAKSERWYKPIRFSLEEFCGDKVTIEEVIEKKE